MILATFSREFSAAFVEEAREQGITAEAAPWAARWTLRKIHMRFSDLEFCRIDQVKSNRRSDHHGMDCPSRKKPPV
jgi:hypothetical protein